MREYKINLMIRLSWGVVVGLLALFSTFNAYAQTDEIDYEPPPLMIVPRIDRDKLEKTTNEGSRNRLSMDLMRARLENAENFLKKGDLTGTFRELGIFQAVKRDALDFLERRKASGAKTFDQFKRLEISLRGFVPRLETIRREMPLTHEKYVADLLRSVRDSRSRATDALFADSVVRTPKPID